MKWSLVAVMVMGCSGGRKCPDGYVKHDNPFFCLPANQKFEPVEKREDGSFAGMMETEQTVKDGWQFRAVVAWYEPGDEHFKEAFSGYGGVSAKPFQSDTQKIEVLKQAELKNGRYVLDKVTTKFDGSPTLAKFCGTTVVRDGTRVLDCGICAQKYGGKENETPPDPQLLESCAKLLN